MRTHVVLARADVVATKLGIFLSFDPATVSWIKVVGMFETFNLEIQPGSNRSFLQCLYLQTTFVKVPLKLRTKVRNFYGSTIGMFEDILETKK